MLVQHDCPLKDEVREGDSGRTYEHLQDDETTEGS